MLISADHVLERISPAVGRFPRHAEDPLGNYLASLARVRELTDGTDGTDGLVLPGHGMPFRGAPSRCTALIEHHEGRIEQCVEACGAEAEPTTAWQVANRVFAHVFARDTLDPADARFATTETLAHLEHARWRGRVSRLRSSDGLVRYWRIDS
jgi:glyoxylase-like metal-dependent hydrolase (beta-lactamase superfamily II)